MNFNFKNCQDESLHLSLNLTKKSFFVRAFKYNFLALYFLTITFAYTSGNKTTPNEVILEDSFINNVPVITSAKMTAPGILEIQFKAPLEASLLKYEYAADGSPFWSSIENISSPLPVNGANGTITIASFSGKSSIRIRAIGSNLIYASDPFFITNSPSAIQPTSK